MHCRPQLRIPHHVEVGAAVKYGSKDCNDDHYVLGLSGLSEASKSDESWIASQAQVKLASREEAEKTVDILNKRNELIVARCREIKRHALERKELNPGTNL